VPRKQGRELSLRTFYKYHALGNDYIVLAPRYRDAELTPAEIRRICDRHRGLGGDGVVLAMVSNPEGALRARIFNPDGSEAEISGNGLRIMARWLYDYEWVSDDEFTIELPTRSVPAQVHSGGASVTVGMGEVIFSSDRIPVAGPTREVLDERLDLDGTMVRFCAATVGNPHCVVLDEEVTPDRARELGPLIEVHPLFPNRTNVQFLSVIDRTHIRIEIWERGAGYTLASGSSSCAAAAVAHRLGLCGTDVTVQMPGGELRVEIDEAWRARLTGPVTKVCSGTPSPEMLE
jgi:diaminopimelate epimerase